MKNCGRITEKSWREVVGVDSPESPYCFVREGSPPKEKPLTAEEYELYRRKRFKISLP
jgi:hypothetical protein